MSNCNLLQSVYKLIENLSDTRNKEQNNQKYNKKLKPTQDGDVSGCKHTNFRNLDHLL
jgi:hypothetical protein